jgi:hypothetical protein
MRSLKLIGTVLQKLANLQLFSQKEAHWDKLNPFLEQHFPSYKKFIDELVEFRVEVIFFVCLFVFCFFIFSFKVFQFFIVKQKNINVAESIEVDIYASELLSCILQNRETFDNSASVSSFTFSSFFSFVCVSD